MDPIQKRTSKLLQFAPEISAKFSRGVQHDDGKIYFFTYVKRRDGCNSKCGRKVRRNGSEIGFWKASQARSKVPKGEGDTGPVGTKTPLAYHELEKDEKGTVVKTRKTNWLMTEFRLPQKIEADDNEQELVLSVVYFNQKSRRE